MFLIFYLFYDMNGHMTPAFSSKYNNIINMTFLDSKIVDSQTEIVLTTYLYQINRTIILNFWGLPFINKD